ncbi:MAG: AAA family ATPase, partial [Clostridiales bacterium]|nr:AAA family ATPase [Clostridiales bacterium]
MIGSADAQDPFSYYDSIETSRDSGVAVTGTVESVIYHNDENGFTVFSIEPEKTDARQLSLNGYNGALTCTAYIPALNEGEQVKLAGVFVNNPRYGRQLSVKQLERAVPDTLDGIEKYLGSGVIKGVGERTAKRIVEAFGARAFDIIEEEPEKLTCIKGVNLEKALRISEAFHAQAALRRVMLFLQGYGISPVYAMKIYRQYKENTVDAVKSNPYRLADDIDGIGFKTADAIARNIGVAADAETRVAAGVRYTLWEAANSGHTYLPERRLTEHACALLDVEEDIIARQLAQMQIERQLYREKPSGDYDGDDNKIYLNAFYHAEQNIAKKLLELSASAKPIAGENSRHSITQSVLAIERENETALSEGQRNAVVSALTNGVLIITGGPGTGKTTAINIIINLLLAQKMRVELTAPTGRAAKRMAEATGREAKTIHRLLETSFLAEDSRKQTFNRNDENPLETDALIVDETSMVDVLLMQSLLKAITPGTRLIMVGDVDQLPSVGPGNVLKDLIASGCLAVARLTEIFRQAQESAIVMNAHRINR